jgi:hypothetical protein
MAHHPTCQEDDSNNLGFRWRSLKKYNYDYKARDMLWTAEPGVRIIFTLSNCSGALYHLFATQDGKLFLSESIQKYAMCKPFLPLIDIQLRENSILFGTVKKDILKQVIFHDKNIYAMLLNSPWGCSEGIFGHYFEEFIPFLLEYSRLFLQDTTFINFPGWLSWSNFTGWRQETDKILTR